MPRGIRLSEEQISEILKLSEMKLTQKDISERTGVSVPTIRRIQQGEHIPASNRYNGGMISSSIRENPSVGVKSVREDIPNDCGVIVAEKVVTLVGSRTAYMYTIGTRTKTVSITTNSNEKDFVIEVKDLVAFGNELLDVAEKLQNLKNEL